VSKHLSGTEAERKREAEEDEEKASNKSALSASRLREISAFPSSLLRKSSFVPSRSESDEKARRGGSWLYKTLINLSVGSNLDKNQSRLFRHNFASGRLPGENSERKLCLCFVRESLKPSRLSRVYLP
jgi:hypothetical protein